MRILKDNNKGFFSCFFRLCLQRRQTLTETVRRIEHDHERLTVHCHIAFVRKIGHPPSGRLPPVLSAPNQEALVIGDQETKLHTVTVPGFEEQVQSSVLGVIVDLLLRWVPVPAEGKEGNAMIGGQVEDADRMVAVGIAED